MAIAIEANGLSRTFGADVHAVRSVDLRVKEGTIFGFLGPNGAGKTTTVRMLTTLLAISSGEARVCGHDVAKAPAAVRRVIGVALQDVGLDPLMTGRELMMLHGQLQGLGRHTSARVDSLLGTVGLADAANQRVEQYSGGMKRRLDLAIALLHQPRVLFLDEPTTGLDPASRMTIWEEIRTLRRGGTTVFLTTQYLEEADRLADEVAIIDNGVIIAAGTPTSLKASIESDRLEIAVVPEDIAQASQLIRSGIRNTAVQETDEGLVVYVPDGPAVLAAAITTLSDGGISVGTVATSSPTLDDVFLAKTGRRLEGADPIVVQVDA